MAQKVQIILVDDLDGGPADELVHFALDGAAYEIDLSSANAAQLRNALAPYLSHARRASALNRPKPAGARKQRSKADPRIHAIRVWAQQQGIPLGDRGRVPLNLRMRYEMEHPGA